MENRRKRTELEDQLPVDKRVCSVLDHHRPSSSSSSAPAQRASTNSALDTVDCEMETSSDSISGRSEKDSAYGSCDSDGVDDAQHQYRIYQNFHRGNSSENHAKFKRILSSLEDDSEPCSQLAALRELCDFMSFWSESSLPGFSLDSFVPILVKLSKHEINPDVMLLAIRALTYICDVLPRSSVSLVRHGAIPALCARLMTIEYLDVAEQCFQALQKISHDHPVPCLQAGAIMAVLSYIDFFSTSIQNVALSIVANICKKLPSDCSSLVIEPVPILCNLLQYEDRKLVENAAMCLIRIVDCLSSSEMLDELCNHGVIHQSTHLIASNSRMTLSQSTYTGLIGLLARFASGSLVAVRTLFELNISSILRNILTTSDLSHAMPYSHLGDMHSNQVHEALKLLIVLLPPLSRDSEGIQPVSDKEMILREQSELLHQFGMDILPVLIQVVGSGASLYVCYGCLSVIHKLVYFSTADILIDSLKNTNISSFLAGVFARKDHHVLISALKIAEIIMQKLPDVFLNSFVKEGVLYAVDALLVSEKCSQFMVQKPISPQHSSGSVHKVAGNDALRCLCYAFDMGQSPLSSEPRSCKCEKDTVHSLAKYIKATYFTGVSCYSEMGSTEILQKLRSFSAVLTDNVNLSTNNNSCAQQEEYLCYILEQTMSELNGGDPMTTFEFIESGIVKSLAHYLSGGMYLKGKVDHHGLSNHFNVVLKRFETFSRVSLSSLGRKWEEMPLTLLVWKLQSALSSLDSFPIIVTHPPRSKIAYADIPSRRCTKHPCLKVRFGREDGETVLCDHSPDILMVEPFTSLDAIERFLWPKVSTTGIKDDSNSVPLMAKGNSFFGSNCDETRGLQDKDAKFMEDCHKIYSGLSVMQKDKFDAKERVIQAISGESSTSIGQTHPVSTKQNVHFLSEVDTSTKAMGTMNAYASRNTEDVSPKMIFCLDGKLLDRSLTLYQAILQRPVNEGHDIIVDPSFWNEVYKVTYRRAEDPKGSDSQKCFHGSRIISACNELRTSWKKLPFFSSMLLGELPCNLDKSNPAYDILFLLQILEGLNKHAFHLISHERCNAFAEGRTNNFDDLKVTVPVIPQTEFLCSKLTEKLEQQLRDPLAVSIGGMPSWCCQLMNACPFLFSFEARRKYFRLAAFGSLKCSNDLSGANERRPHGGVLLREKFKVHRSNIMDSAAKMMDLHARKKTILEVEYSEEVGTGLGPTLEFYTLVSHEFQKAGLGMWRNDHCSTLQVEDRGFVLAPLGLFPRPWPAGLDSSKGIYMSEVIKKFVLLGKIVAKALQDGRVLDLPFSKAFYKLILGQELDIYGIHSFDPELGRTLLEFQALVYRKKFLDSVSRENTTFTSDLCFHNTRIEDLCLDFTLPGYPDYELAPGHNKMVNSINLDEYVSLVVDATVRSGVYRQVEAFKSGFNQVFPLKTLQIFTEDEIERLVCGEQDTWVFGELLDHVKFDHGYTASSRPVINLLEIVEEFVGNQRRAFLQFVTGAPRLPPGGLAALHPKLTIVRKHCSGSSDGDLPSVMTCANYLKLPPYSSKERMRERLLYAITEGQGSFHLS
ncbi:ubiquitin-protein ligase 4 [Tasmannia lanceolata]|uniref:ubiquitin-protein ligase 4 n=1 Tax=Tasmannia lanceolata TaxID=3420 RepID=UPI00406386AD